MHQQENECTEVIYERLEAALLNMKLVGGNMHLEELQSKEKSINPLHSYKYNVVTVKDKLMGTLLVES